MALAAMLVPLAAAPAPAQSNSKVDARYDISLAGIEIGKAALVVDIDGTSYTAAASAKVTGVAQIVADGKGSAGARGTLGRERPMPTSFALTATGDDKTIEVQFALDPRTSTAKDISLTPPPAPRPDRVPVTDAHRRGVLDPMSAILMPVTGNGDPLSPEACNRTLPIFDGAGRYDLAFAFERVEQVKTKGYAGPAAVCRVAFKAISGHRAGRKDVEYMEKNKDVFVWLAPAEGSRVLVPFRISVATRIGTVLVNARVFNAAPGQTRAAAPAPSQAGTAR
jgi:hypothetical protein